MFVDSSRDTPGVGVLGLRVARLALPRQGAAHGGHGAGRHGVNGAEERRTLDALDRRRLDSRVLVCTSDLDMVFRCRSVPPKKSCPSSRSQSEFWFGLTGQLPRASFSQEACCGTQLVAPGVSI